VKVKLDTPKRMKAFYAGVRSIACGRAPDRHRAASGLRSGCFSQGPV